MSADKKMDHCWYSHVLADEQFIMMCHEFVSVSFCATLPSLSKFVPPSSISHFHPNLRFLQGESCSAWRCDDISGTMRYMFCDFSDVRSMMCTGLQQVAGSSAGMDGKLEVCWWDGNPPGKFVLMKLLSLRGELDDCFRFVEFELGGLSFLTKAHLHTFAQPYGLTYSSQKNTLTYCMWCGVAIGQGTMMTMTCGIVEFWMQARAYAEKDGEYFDISHKLLGSSWLWLPWLSHSRSCVSARLRNAYYQNEASIASNLQPIGILEAKAGVVSRCFKHPIAQRTTSCSHNSPPWVGWIMSNPSRLLEFRTLSYASYCGSNSEDVLMRFTWRKNLSS